MDFKNAFTYMFKDKNFWLKYLIGTALLIPATLSNIVSPENPFVPLIPFIKDISATNLNYIFYTVLSIGLITCFLVCGYNIINLNTRIYKSNADLPEWKNIKEIVLCGLKVIALLVISMIPISIFLAILTVVFVIILSLFFKSGLSVLVAIASLLSILIVGIILLLFIPAAIIAFATNLKISSFFNIKLIFNIIKENKLKYFIYVVSYLIFFLIFSAFSQLAYTRFYPTIIFLPFVSFYIGLVIAEIQASVPRPEEKAQIETTEQGES